jgi:replication factor A1
LSPSLQGKNAQIESISKKVGGGGGGDPRKTFKAVQDERLGYQEKPDYFVVKGTVTFYRHDMEKPPWYNACPAPDCNKKVTQNDPAGLWFCEKCDKSYPAPVPR